MTAGTLQLSKTSVNGTILGELTVGGGGGGDTVQLTADNQIADTALIHVNSFGLLDLNSNTETTGAVDGAGQIDMGVGGTFRAGSGNGSSTFSGTIVGSGNLLKLGTGIWTLTGTNTYTANTTVSAGTLLVNGSQPQSPVTVNGTATIGGSGIIGNLFVFGSLKPGNSPGILTCSNFVCNSSSSDYFVELTGPVAGTDYDQLNVRGTNALASATLHLTTAFTTPVGINQTFTILNNDAAEAITGTFNGLAEGATISSGGYKFTISYTGGTGNDVQLNLTDVPAAEVSASVTAGNGNHAIDPNECNSLNLVITNKSGALMTGISATLSTTTGRVLITQPYSTYANIAANGKGTNTTPFQISTLPGFFCGTNITLQLIVDSSAGSFITSFMLPTGEVAATPFRYDNNVITAIPDIGSVDSATAVAAFSGPLEKVAVSLFITHPIDSDLNLSLVSPDGTIVPLTVGIGAGANFGSSSNDVNRTTFDDAAATAITASAPPFVGTFRPQGSLANYIFNGTPNGSWKLRIADANGGTLGTLRNWSLFLYPVACNAGGGNCDYCLPPVTNSITAGDLSQTNRLTRDVIVAGCGAPKVFPGGFPGSYHYDVYSFTNTTASDACVTVLLTASCDVQAGVYLNAFDPVNIATNYLGDSGFSTAGGIPQSCSVTIPAGAKFIVTVNEVFSGTLCGGYTLQLSGLPCPDPTLAINKAAPTNSVRVNWPTSAGGYQLEALASLSKTNWAAVTNEPLVNAGRFNVTNSMNPTNAFYRLKKP